MTYREIVVSHVHRNYVIVTDSQEQAQNEAGEVIITAEENLFNWDRVFDLSEVVGRRGPQRDAAENITLYKGLGIALEDIAAAAHVYKQALTQGFGEELPLLP